mgnify:CR=1 FL=1
MQRGRPRIVLSDPAGPTGPGIPMGSPQRRPVIEGIQRHTWPLFMEVMQLMGSLLMERDLARHRWRTEALALSNCPLGGMAVGAVRQGYSLLSAEV